MVVFTCNNCGETLQKPRVAKHYQFKCRNAVFLTCVDCFKDFRGDEYVAHTKCITEAERYGGKDYVPKAGTNKGERKQQEWINIVNNLLESSTNLSNAERGFLNSLSKFSNIPRKKPKFLNFVRNAVGNRANAALLDSVWNKMETAYKNNVQSMEQQENGKVNEKEDCKEEKVNGSFSGEQQENNIAENQNNENICRESQGDEHPNGESHVADVDSEKPRVNGKRKKSKKRQMSETAEEQNEELVSKKKSKNASVLSESSVNQCDTSDRPTFSWKDTILNIVQTKGEMSLKKLQKKVVSRYMNQCSDAVTYEKASSKFTKKLKKIPEIVVSDEQVKLA